ncbi:MAG: DUF2332 domain-containing protein [Pseudomonadota bacterium]
MADEAANRAAFRIQQHYCATNQAPIYARMCGAVAEHLRADTPLGARILGWPGEPTRDALPLRFFGGLHALVQAGADGELAEVYAGRITDEAAIGAIVNRVARDHGAMLMPWLDGPPQTNEPGRSAALMLGLLEIARRHGPRIEIVEIGSSGGLNLLIGAYRFDLGGTMVGPADAPVTMAPRWTGAPAPVVPITIERARGCDVAPRDVTDPAVAARLAAYVWPDTPQRLERLRRVIAMARERGVRVDRADAADWIEARLAEPQEPGVARVLMHSVVWQYLPDATADRVRAAMEAAGTRATAERPVGWVAMEPDRALAHQVVRVRSWPGHGDWRACAFTHAHGTWIDTAMEKAAAPVVLPDSARVTL